MLIRELRIDVDGIHTRYFEAGSGAPLVLLHGASLAIDAWATWYRAIPHLAKTHRVIAPDLVGFGETGGRHVNRLKRSRHALGFLRALGLRDAALVGHSEGGFIATLLAIEHPDLVQKVAIVTSGATAPRLSDAPNGDWMEAARKAYDYRSGSCDTLEGFIKTNAILSVTNPEDFLAIMRKNYASAMHRGQLDDFKALQADAEAYGRMQEQHIFPRLSTLQAELFLIWARQDATVPVERGLKLQALTRAADIHVLNNAAHMVMIDRDAAFNRVLSCWAAA